VTEPIAPRWPPGFATTHEDRTALLALVSDPGLTPRSLLELGAVYGTASRSLAALRNGEVTVSRKGRAGPGKGKASRTASPHQATEIDVETVGADLARAGGRFVVVGDPEYPPELLQLFDPPAGLFVKGGEVQGMRPRVGIVGARNCSPSGTEMARALGAAICAAGGWVVSGGARGIDGAAHEGALSAGGRTIAVLGTGIDLAYPPEHADLLADVAARGAVVTEYPPGTHAHPYHFPARNRIVAALSCAVVVVEGATGSGSLITADHALDIGREIYAVPGAVTSPLAEVPLSLIREGATMIRGPDDLLFDLHKHFPSLSSDDPEDREAAVEARDRRRRERARQAGPRPGVPPESLARSEREVWDSLTSPSDVDRLSSATGLSLGTVTGVLVGLEMRGLVRRVGGRFERTLGAGR
jgi:DNA processing protein